MGKHRTEAEALDAEWRAKWPDHCTRCDGWGGWTFYPLFHLDPPEFVACPQCQDTNEFKCPRCGAAGETWDDEGGVSEKCSKCGWDPDNPDGAYGYEIELDDTTEE